jgi:transcriptional regulator with XRE-family HTH domain
MNRIKEIMAQKGWDKLENPRPTQKVLDTWGVSIKAWNKWVEKEKDPDLSLLPALAEFLQVPVVELIEEKEVSHG